MTKKEKIQETLVNRLKAESDKMLQDLWNLTKARKDDGVFTLRGFIMEEIERRMPEAEFDVWLEAA